LPIRLGHYVLLNNWNSINAVSTFLGTVSKDIQETVSLLVSLSAPEGLLSVDAISPSSA
jgi:hypothetical protein